VYSFGSWAQNGSGMASFGVLMSSEMFGRAGFFLRGDLS
jgi:hypothetical protein